MLSFLISLTPSYFKCPCSKASGTRSSLIVTRAVSHAVLDCLICTECIKNISAARGVQQGIMCYVHGLYVKDGCSLQV